MKLKIIRYALALCLALALLLSGCRNAPVTGSNPPVGEVFPSASLPTQASPPFSSQGMRLALCTSPGFIDDRGRNSSCYDGILSFLIGRNGIDSVAPLQETSGDPDIAPQAFRDMVSSYDVMIFVGSAFSKIGSLAQDNPDKYFILIDAPLTDDNGAPVQMDNACSLEFAEQECGFYAGMAAAMESETGRIAIITDTPSPTSIRYYYGFRSGVAYANGNLNTSAEIVEHPAYGGVGHDGTPLGGNYTETSDVTAYALSNSLIDEGCDILFVAAGSSGIGAINAVKGRPGVRIIGSETDQFLNGVNGTENIVLTSVTKNYTAAVIQQLQSIVDDTFQSGAFTLRSIDNGTGYASADDRQQLKAETLTALAEAYSFMQDGTIVPMAGPAA